MNQYDGASRDIERIREKKSLNEILEVATAFEKSAQGFYTGMIPKVSKNISWLVEELAEEEQRHYILLTELSTRPDLGDQISALVDTPASDGKFADCILMQELGENPDDQTVLQYAMGREHIAMEQYHALAESTEPGPIKKLFQFLANEETGHKAELEKLYYEMVYSSGVYSSGMPLQSN